MAKLLIQATAYEKNCEIKLLTLATGFIWGKNHAQDVTQRRAALVRLSLANKENHGAECNSADSFFDPLRGIEIGIGIGI